MKLSLNKAIFLLCLPILLYGRAFHVELDNDVVVASDEKYTGGLNLIFMGDRYDKDEESYYNNYVAFMRDIYKWVPGTDLQSRALFGSFSLQQITMTPDDINVSEPIYNDMPYYGSLQAHFSLFACNVKSFDEYRFHIGVVGKYALSETMQNRVHELTGNQEAKGWDNQLGVHYGAGFGYLHGARAYEAKIDTNYRFEWFYSYFADVGTSYIGGGAGTLVRFGKNTPRNIDVPTSLFNHAPNKVLNLYNRPNGLGYSMELGTSFNTIAYSYLYSEAEKRGYTIERNRLILTSKIALNLYYKSMSFAFEFYPMFTRERDPQSTSWGRLSFGWSY